MVWTPNPNEDFVPYFDKIRNKWAISIQYLGVWYYKTEENAQKAIADLMRYREKVLKEIDKQNRQYYRKLMSEANDTKRALKDYRRWSAQRTTRTIKQLSVCERKELRSMVANGYDEEQIKERFEVSTATIGQIRKNQREKQWKNLNCQKSTNMCQK